MTETDSNPYPISESFQNEPISSASINNKYNLEPIYKLNPNNKGQVLIFNHNKFEIDNLPARPGTNVDMGRLEETFQKLNFDTTVYNDEKDVIQILKNVKDNKEKLNKTDCLIVIILTHGDRQYLYTYDNKYSVCLLWEEFYTDKCKELATKPKLFIIQACRGASASSKTTVSTDSINMYSIPSEAHILVAYSTFEGRVSHRDTVYGTWFIQELCSEINSEQIEDFLSILTNVNRHVAVKYENNGNKQMPFLQSTLLQKLYINQIPDTLNNFDLKQDIKKLKMKYDNMARIMNYNNTNYDNQNSQNDSFIKTVEYFLQDNENINKDLRENLSIFVGYLKGINVTMKTKKQILKLIKENSNWKYINMLQDM